MRPCEQKNGRSGRSVLVETSHRTNCRFPGRDELTPRRPGADGAIEFPRQRSPGLSVSMTRQPAVFTINKKSSSKQ
eukprot:gene30684-35708_t